MFDKYGDLVKNFFFHFKLSLQLVSLLFSVQKRFGHKPNIIQLLENVSINNHFITISVFPKYFITR